MKKRTIEEKKTSASKFQKALKQWIIFILGALVLYNGIAFMVIADVGMSPYDAFTKTISEIIGIQYGTAGMITGGMFFLINLLILRKKFPPREFAQVVIFIGGGFFTNFLLDVVYSGLSFSSFWVNIAIFTLATPVVAFGCLIIFEAQLMSTPLESLCATIAPHVHSTLGIIRWISDGIFLVVTLVLILLLDLPWAISFGTVISLALFGPLLDILRKPTSAFIRFLHLKD